MSFEKALAFTLKWEGGYVNDPSDPGGETNFGITKRAWDEYRMAFPHLPVSVKDIPKSEVEKFYFRKYWLPAKCDELPAPLDMVHFDACVNVGKPEDGFKRANSFLEIGGNDIEKTIKAREDYYSVLVLKNPKLVKFIKGWMNRTKALRKEACL